MLPFGRHLLPFTLPSRSGNGSPTEDQRNAVADDLADLPKLNAAAGSGSGNGRIFHSTPFSATDSTCKTQSGVRIKRMGEFKTGNVGRGSVEILAYDKLNKRIVFVEAGTTSESSP
jgi:hypothetical protein